MSEISSTAARSNGSPAYGQNPAPDGNRDPQRGLCFTNSGCAHPLSSLNPEIERITSDKPHLYIMNKADLADPDITAQWLAYFKAPGLAACP